MPSSDILATLHTFSMALSFILGCLVGSFCNVCASRWPAGESVVSPRSRCPKCRNAIAWYDNIPLISWLILGAKCRHCGKSISWQYPLVEALTGLLFMLVFLRFGYVAATPVYMALCAALVIVTFQDLADWTIPNEITFPGIPIGLALALVGMVYPDSMLRVTDPINAVIGMALGGGFLYALDRVTVLLLKKPGMGFGDAKLLAMLGAFFGWKGFLLILMLGAITGSIVGGLMIAYFRFRGEKEESPAPEADEATDDESGEEAAGSDDEITLEGHYLPFGPYLALGGLLYMFFGPELIDWWLGLTSAPINGGMTLM